MNSWVRLETVECFGSTNSRTGLVNANRIRVLTLSVMVAENNIV